MFFCKAKKKHKMTALLKFSVLTCTLQKSQTNDTSLFLNLSSGWSECTCYSQTEQDSVYKKCFWNVSNNRTEGKWCIYSWQKKSLYAQVKKKKRRNSACIAVLQ